MYHSTLSTSTLRGIASASATWTPLPDPHWLRDRFLEQIEMAAAQRPDDVSPSSLNSTGKGIIIGMSSALASAALIALILIVLYIARCTQHGRVFLDRIGRPGEYDDEQEFLRQEEEALSEMDETQRTEYARAKESMQTDISLSQFLAIQEKGVSAWEFEPELEIANCFVEGRTEIEFFDSECSVQSNLPIPKQNEVYYWEAKMFDKPESTLISIGLTTKPYPLFRLPGWHKFSIAYTSLGQRRYNQPFHGTNYGPVYEQGDVIGVGYRPRTGTVFFTRNGKKLEDIAHGLKSQNFFPTVGADGPCNIHVNFGQMGFVFIEANVKKWGLAPMNGSLAPPPPYGNEQGSILLQGGSNGVGEGQGYLIGQGHGHSHGRSQSAQVVPPGRYHPTSPGPQRSPTEISLAQLDFLSSQDQVGGSTGGSGLYAHPHGAEQSKGGPHPGTQVSPTGEAPPPEYESPTDDESDLSLVARFRGHRRAQSEQPLLSRRGARIAPPIPTYEAAVANDDATNRLERR